MDINQLLTGEYTEEPPEGYVRRTGPIFKVGTYEDQKFSLSTEEMDNAIANFSPVKLDLEHKPSVLEDALGVVRKVWRDGEWLQAEADIPNWLDKVLAPTKSAVSCAWDYATKNLKGLAWTVDPAIGEAALFTAYAQFTAAQTAPLTPSPTMSTVGRMTKKEKYMSLRQQLQTQLAKFSSVTPAPEPVPPIPPVEPAPVPPPVPPTPTPVPPPPAAPAASFSAPGADVAMEEGVAEFKATQIIARATELADALIADGHLFSVARNAAIAAFSNAGYDNEVNGPLEATFARADNTIINDRVSLLLEVLRGTPQHSLFNRTMPTHVLNGTGSATDATKALEEAGRAQAKRYREQREADKISTNGHSG